MTTTSEYERTFADWLGVRHAFSFWKGRVALYAALRALEIGEGDEVVVPGYTCVMAVNPIMYVGAKPVYVDIEPVTYNLNPTLLEPSLTDRTKAIVAQHTYGYPADMDAIMAVADARGIPVIEDSCLAVGSRWNGRSVGTFGVAAYFSTQWNKPYTTGLGGMLAMNDDSLARRVSELCAQEAVAPGLREVALLSAQLVTYRTLVYPRTTAMAQAVFRWLTRMGLVVGSSSPAEFTPTMETGFFARMSSRQARLGLRAVRRLAADIEHRRKLSHLYERQLELHGWLPPRLPPQSDPVLVRYPVRVTNKKRALAMAARRFIELGSWFECPLHPIETPLGSYGYEAGMCPEAERASREVVNLPVHTRASAVTVQRTVEFIAEIGWLG